MPELAFHVTGVEPAARGITPLLHFRLELANAPADEVIDSVMLHAQIQIESPRRAYAPAERERLVELFGAPGEWSRTLRNRLWAHAQTIVPSFSGSIVTVLPVACTFDLNVAATKYAHALDDGEIPLLFLFSGSVFYRTHDRRMQVQPISWNSECAYRMPVETWKTMIDALYPNLAWLMLERETFDRLHVWRLRNGAPSWDQAIDRLLAASDGAAAEEMPAVPAEAARP